MIIQLNHDLQRKLEKMKQGEIFGQGGEQLLVVDEESYRSTDT